MEIKENNAYETIHENTHEGFQPTFQLRFECKEKKKHLRINNKNTAQDLQVLLHIAVVLVMRKQFLEANYFNFPHHLRKMHSKQNTEPDPALLQPHQ